MNNFDKTTTLKRAASIEGIYVPSLYSVEYNDNGTVFAFKYDENTPFPVTKRIVKDFNSAEFYSDTPVPMIEVVHDRTTLELMRGCIRGCRFCQAGYIYRPVRTKTVDTLCEQAKEQCNATGYDEISLLSLSTGDYPKLNELIDSLFSWTTDKKVNLSLPSLRIDSFDEDISKRVASVRNSSLTFAPEAGSQRLRDIINKNLTEEEILSGCKAAFVNGYPTVKLYFMIGLPFETDEDILAIASLSQKIVDLYYSLEERPKAALRINVSVAYFVPKPFTPFQFVSQNSMEEFKRKQTILSTAIRSKRISLSYHEADSSYIEAVLARGDRRISKLILAVYMAGGKFESWKEGFLLSRWEEKAKELGIDLQFYANRTRNLTEIMPWDILDYGVSRQFLVDEFAKSKNNITTSDCRKECSLCGISKLFGRPCFEYA